MIIKTKNPNYRIRLTRCWLVELVDKDESVVEGTDRYGDPYVCDEYCFGTKEDAVKEGESLLRLTE